MNDINEFIASEFKRDRVKFPIERRKKVMKILLDCIEFKVSLIPKDGKLMVSHYNDNPVDLHYYKLADEFAMELCEVILRLVNFARFKKWKPIKETFDYKYILTNNTYLLLQQSDYLYELELVLVKDIKGKLSRVRIAQGLTEFMIPCANKFACELMNIPLEEGEK